MCVAKERRHTGSGNNNSQLVPPVPKTSKMTTLNQGRNEIRFNNSDGKCLLENWVEERAVAHIDPANLNSEVSSSAQQFRNGHDGLLTTNSEAAPEKVSTVHDSYRPPQGPNVRLKGSKQEMLEKMLYEKISKEVHDEFNPPPSISEYKSVTHKDFNKDDFVSKRPAPTQHHDLVKEQPVTFWTEHKEKIHGKSQHKQEDTPFRKNTAFSKPIEEYLDQPKPYEHAAYPNMSVQQ